MVKFFCDRCGNEVESLDALLEFSISVAERPSRSLWSWRGEVCQDCYGQMREEIINRILPPPPGEENKKKGMKKTAP